MTQELENLIEAIIADDVITEKERAVLHAKAAKEGIDVDEIDVLVEGRLAQKKNRAFNGANAPVPPVPPAVPIGTGPTPPPISRPKREINYGVVHRCPKCGSAVESGRMSCEACGYAFRGIEANSSVQRLSDLINEAASKQYSGIIGFKEAEKHSAIVQIIQNFPIPSTKEDLLELIFFTKSKSFASLTDTTGLEGAYRKKYNECIDKARFYFPNDPQIRQILEDDREQRKHKWKNMSSAGKSLVLILSILFGLFIFLFLLILIAE